MLKFVEENYGTMGHIWKKHVLLDESPYFCELCNFRSQKQSAADPRGGGGLGFRFNPLPPHQKEGVEYTILRKHEANLYWKEKARREQPHSLSVPVPIESSMMMSPATPACHTSTDSVGVPDRDARIGTLLEAIAPELTSAPEYVPTPIMTPIERETAVLSNITIQNNDQEYVPTLSIIPLNTAPATTITSAPHHTPPTQKRHKDDVNVPSQRAPRTIMTDSPCEKIKKRGSKH